MTFENFVRSGKYLRSWSPKTERVYLQAWASFQQSLASATGATGVSAVANVSLTTEASVPLTSTGHDAAAGTAVLCKARLEAWVVWMKERGRSNAGINCYIRAINSFVSWLTTEGHLDKTIRLKLLPTPGKPLRGFSDLEIRSLLSFRPRGFTELRTFTLIQVLIDTGCRIDEVLGVLKQGVNMDDLFLTVTGKGNKTRHVPISLELRKTVWKYLNVPGVRDKNRGFLFSTRSGHKLSYRNTYRDIKNLCAKAGVEGSHVHPHAFRHCFAVTYIRRGGDIYRLSRILGHTSVGTTQLYLRSMGIEAISENHSSLSPLSKHS